MPTELRATYRLQFHAGFTLDHASAIIDYLADLGISHLYSSPYLQARQGSTHGYDVVNPQRVNAELGAYRPIPVFVGRSRDMALVRCSISCPIIWRLRGLKTLGGGTSWKMVLPVVMRLTSTLIGTRRRLDCEIRCCCRFSAIIMGAHLRLGRFDSSATIRPLSIRYHEHIAPVEPESLDGLLAMAAERCRSDMLAFIADALGWLPPATATDWASVQRRHRDKEVLRQQLARFLVEQPGGGAAIDGVIAAMNADADALDALLERQNYRLAFWRAAAHDLGYRRFSTLTRWWPCAWRMNGFSRIRMG